MASPVISIQNLNAQLSSQTAKFDLLSVVNSAQTAVSQYATSVETVLGTQIGQTVGGFQSLTQELDNTVPIVNGVAVVSPTLSALSQTVTGIGAAFAAAEDLAGSLSGYSSAAGQLNSGLENTAGVSNRGIALLTENPPGLDIKKPTSSSNGDIQALTEDTVEGGFLEFAITAATPEAIAKTLGQVTGEPTAKIANAVQSLAPGIVGVPGNVQQVVGSVLSGSSVVQDLIGSVSGFITNTLAAATQGLTGLINNIVEVSVAPFQSVIDSVLKEGTALPVDLNLQVKGLVELGLTSQAAELLLPYSNLSLNELEANLLQIPTSLSNMLTNNSIQVSITTPINIIGSNK